MCLCCSWRDVVCVLFLEGGVVCVCLCCSWGRRGVCGCVVLGRRGVCVHPGGRGVCVDPGVRGVCVVLGRRGGVCVVVLGASVVLLFADWAPPGTSGHQWRLTGTSGR